MYSRPKKETHFDTIAYEMDMLRFCFSKLKSNDGKWDDQRDFNVYLEGFLLHYRNLIEFFADHSEVRLSSRRSWAPGVLSAGDLNSLKNTALYRRWRGPISRYLQHINRIRAERDRDWPVDQMHAEIEQNINTFERIFPRTTGQELVVERPSPLSSAHTATITRIG